MQTLAETGATPTPATSSDLPRAAWVAAGLAAGASLLRWIGANTDTHSWAADAVVSLIAGAALMALAIVLVAGPWSVRTARAVYLIAAVGTAVVVTAFLLPLLLAGPTAPGHVGHDVGGGEGVATVDAIRTAVEVALIGVLLWMHRLTDRRTPRVTEEPG